jgi:hypothetical protein
MASILKVDELRGIASAGDITITSEGGAATQSLQQGLAKAWVNFNGTGTIATRDSLNTSSLTDNATGDYTVTISNALSNANYSFVGTCAHTNNGGSSRCHSVSQKGSNTPTTTVYHPYLIFMDNGNSGITDSAYVMTQITGDLA